MSKTRIISGLTAFLLAASSVAVYAADGLISKYNPGEVISYLNSDGEDTPAYLFDINCDNKTDILDLIYSKGVVLGELEIDPEKITVEYLNNAAAIIAGEARTLMQEMETLGLATEKLTYSSEETDNTEKLNDAEKKMAEKLDAIAKYHGIDKWTVVFSKDYILESCITGDDIIQRSGAYPAMIPRTLNIPYAEALTEYAQIYYYDWNTEFGSYRSSDPSQANLSDFSAGVRLSERSKIAKNIFNDLQTLAQEFETAGKTLPDGAVSSDDDSEFVNTFKKYYPEYSSVKWTADISTFVVNSVIAEGPRDGYCSAYPNEIPARLNIPYSSELLPYASENSEVWTEKFADCATDDQEQLEYIALCEKTSTDQLNSYAKYVFTSAQTLLQEYETNGELIDFDGSEYSEKQTEFINKLSEDLPNNIKNKDWKFTARNGVVMSAAVADEDASGTYPNIIPADMRIPYSDDILKNAADEDFSWKENYSECILETVEYEMPPYFLERVQKNYINGFNSNAKSVFTNSQTVLQEMETNGETLPEGIVTSDDDTDFVKKVKALITGGKNCKWAVYISKGVVKGSVFSNVTESTVIGYQQYDIEKGKFIFVKASSETPKYTGSYPVTVPADTVIEYDHSLAEKYSTGSYGSYPWGWTDSSEESGSETGSETGNVSQAAAALTATYNKNAKSIFEAASMVFIDHETMGTMIPNGIITSDDGSDIAAEINALVVGGNRKWAVYVKDFTAAGVVYTENGMITGSYPVAVSADKNVMYDHKLAEKYADNSMSWS